MPRSSPSSVAPLRARSWPRAAPLLAALAAAPACTKNLPDGTRVERVAVRGERAMDEDQIVEGLATHPPRATLFFFQKEYAEYDDAMLARDRERIVSYYGRRGYFGTQVTDVVVKRLDAKRVDVTFVVDEGRPTRVDTLAVLGVPSIPEGKGRLDLDEIIPLSRGDIYSEERYVLGKQQLEAGLIERGYAHADVGGRVEVDREERRANVSITVDPGPLVRFGDTKVNGEGRIPESSIRARIAWEPGDIYEPALIERTRGRLYQLGFYSSVSAELVNSDARSADGDMLIELGRSQRHELRLGAGVAVDNANTIVRPRVGYRIRGWIDPLLTFSFDARPGYIVTGGQGGAGNLAGEITVAADRPDILIPRLETRLALVAEVVELETFSYAGFGVRLGVQRPLFDDRLIVSTAYQARLLDITDVDEEITAADRELIGLPAPGDVTQFALDYNLGTLEHAIAYDRRNDPFDARQGVFAQVTLAESVPALRSDFTFVRLNPEARAYVNPFDRLVLAGRINYGTTLTGTLPATDRFYSGGASSHRGFSFRRLSPRSSGSAEPGEGPPIGGAILLETSLEARFDVVRIFGEWLSVAGFLDGGDVTLRASDLALDNLHWAAGPGLRYDTIVGPVRVDLGFRLNRRGPGEPDRDEGFVFHFSIGQAF